ncbi:pectinesterase [Rhizomicrobium palustre]|uniref:Pectinesterase n=1 Tax=Rhizomicrobium palustre TaxID=189966 RepID=A0A846MWI2_9PROT|nr:alpha/beta hydrolase [Rhizomicrobium palustre]NIK87432.1 pectinesterase [Rhizomicrobium palustre]
MKRLFAAALFLLLPANAQDLIPVDDSYTTAQRYNAYKIDFPEIELPVLNLQTGQKILADRLYKKAGGRALYCDVFLPKPQKARHQAVLFVHGGAWRSGRKSNFYAIANLLAQRGYVVLIPDYRLAPEAGYPAGLIDLNDAIVWAKSQAKEFGFAPDKIAISGGSSGGQMAALLAYSADKGLFKSAPGQDTRVNALINLDGLFDFTTPLALKNENAAGAKSPAALWLGGAYETAGEKWREASASNYVDVQSPPTLIIGSGMARFTAGREAVMADLDRLHIRNTYLELTHVPHTFWLFDPYLNQIVQAMDSFLSPRDSSAKKKHGK